MFSSDLYIETYFSNLTRTTNLTEETKKYPILAINILITCSLHTLSCAANK